MLAMNGEGFELHGGDASFNPEGCECFKDTLYDHDEEDRCYVVPLFNCNTIRDGLTVLAKRDLKTDIGV